MTIQFNCPRCGSLIAFADKHAGKPAKCLNCGQQLTIPEKTGQTPKKLEPQVEPKVPQPGFYRAVFVDSWKIFFDKDNLTAIVFVTAAVCFKFFSAGACCLAFIMYFAAWGYLFRFYLNVIYETAVGGDKLPEIEAGTLWYVIKPLLVFSITLFLVELPFFIVMAITQKSGVNFESAWHHGSGVDLLLIFLFVGGLFIFPMAILTVAMMDDWSILLRPKQVFAPIIRAFVPYLIVVAILAAACFIETTVSQYKPQAKEPWLSVAGKLAVNLAEQVVAIIAMRSIGLFYRHFGCYFGY
jgi:hypothetical protein